MKKVFEQFISTFKLLRDRTRQSHFSEILIPKIFARIRPYLVMLSLILKINDRNGQVLLHVHPMAKEEIMITLLQESDYISMELLSPLLHSVL